MRRFDRLLTKIPEHTWGEDTTWYLGDNVNWTNAQFQSALPQHNYQLTINSWLEQRSYLPNAVAVLAASEDGESYHQLADQINRSLATLVPNRPTDASLRAAGLQPLSNPSPAQTFSCQGITIGFGADGSVTTLAGNHAWASPHAPLGKYTYQSVTPEDFVAFDKDYGKRLPHTVALPYVYDLDSLVPCAQACPSAVPCRRILAATTSTSPI